MVVVIFYRKLHTLHNRPLALRADLLCTLEGNEGHLEIMRCLLEDCFLVWLERRRRMNFVRVSSTTFRRTSLLWSVESFFKSSEPRFAIARVASVRS